MNNALGQNTGHPKKTSDDRREPEVDIVNHRIFYRETKGSNASLLSVPILASIAVTQSFCTVYRSS